MVRIILVLSFIVLANGDVIKSYHGYHMNIGVPRALEIKAKETQDSLRIIGENHVKSAPVMPHQVGIVALLTTNWSSICGGSLISNTRVLTAAHCWWDGESQVKIFTIVLGSLTIFRGGTRIETSDVTAHPSWNINDITNDIAIVRISSVTYNSKIQAISLPTLADVNQDFAGLSGKVSGWGKTSDYPNAFPTTSALSQTNVTIMTNAVCQDSFSFALHGSHLCTSGQDRVGTCHSNSGGGLTVAWNNSRIQVGIVSFGLSDVCKAGLPSVYTRITAYLTWINSQL